MRQKIIKVLLFAAGFVVGLVPPTLLLLQKSAPASDIYITSIEDGASVHSRIWIDASFPEGTYEKEVRINGTKKANYTPYLWNNMRENAGKYIRKITGKYKQGNSNLTAEKSIEVFIPTCEVFVGDRNNFTEDHVIHEGQSITWRDGCFNLSSPIIENGGGLYTPFWLDVYGNLTMENITLTGLRGGECGGVGRMEPRINVRGNGRLVINNSDFHADGIAKIICIFDDANIISNMSIHSDILYF